MHCLYCDRPLALLKRLTGDGEFCSKEHRKIYQREHNQLALARLLEVQPSFSGKATSPKSKQSNPDPVTPVQAGSGEENLPGPADFMSEFPEEIISLSGALQFTGDPRFAERAADRGDVLLDPKSRELGVQYPQPRGARFRSESIEPRSSEAAVRSPSQFRLPPVGGLLAQTLPSSEAVILSPAPASAGFASQPPTPRLASETVSQQFEPHFHRTVVKAQLAEVAPTAANDPKLRPARFLTVTGVEPFIPGGIRRLPAEPRWKPLLPAFPVQPAGKIIYVSGPFLQRPVRTANQDGSPGVFEIPLRPVSFPPFSPRMGCLDERLHRTDRVGFCPP